VSEIILVSKDVLIVKGEDVAKVANELSNPTRVQILNFMKEKDSLVD